MAWVASALVVVAALALANSANLPGWMRVLLVTAAFGLGAAFERVRRARPGGSPLSTVASTVGTGRALAAGALLATALVILLLPGNQADPGADRSAEATAPISVGSLPEVTTRRQRAGKRFTVSGASFRVVEARGEGWPADIRRVSAGPGKRWVTVAVEASNTSRRRFNPTTLSYRLTDPSGQQYYPDRSGGTGPPSLGATGSVERGQTAEARLGFRVPRPARVLSLVFEPVQPSSVQVRVRLRR